MSHSLSRGGGWRSLLVFTAVALLAGAGGAWLMQRYGLQPVNGTPQDTFTTPAQPRVASEHTAVSAALSGEQAHVAERVLPGVVSIQVQRRVPAKEGVLKPGGVESVERTRLEPGVGSGAIISREGHIVTNWHVVEGGTDDIYVTLSGEAGARHATLVDKDDQIDIALLRVQARHKGEEFTALRFGDSDKVKRGHLVFAFGSPFNLRETMTNGMVSHCERRVSDTLTAYIQTTCLINPGNSGGPLVNLEGDIIGLVTRKLLGPDETVAAEGYGLAIPGNDVLEAVDRLRSKGRPRIYLGLAVNDWPEGAWQRGQPSEAVIITGVDEKSPAEKAGLRQGDIIDAIDGRPVTSSAEYRRATRARSVGETLKFTFRRNGEVKEASAVLEDFDKAIPPGSTAPPKEVYGVTVRALKRNEQNQLHRITQPGLVVTGVAADSPLAGIVRPGTCILGVVTPDLTPTYVATPDEFETALRANAATGGHLVIAAPEGPPDPWVEFPALDH